MIGMTGANYSDKVNLEMGMLDVIYLLVAGYGLNTFTGLLLTGIWGSQYAYAMLGTFIFWGIDTIFMRIYVSG